MKFSCRRELLIKNLQIAQRATDPKSNITILRNVLIDLKEDRMDIIGFDHRIGIKTGMECTVEEPGRITVPCALLLEILGAMGEEMVYFTLDGYILNIECDKSRYNLNCLSAEDFPQFPEIKEEKSFEVEAGILEKGIRQTILATNPDDPRAFMGGVYIKGGKEELVFVGTDGHRLAFRRFQPEAAVPEFEVIVPTRTLSELLRIIGEVEPEKLKIGVGEKSVSFTMDGVFVISRLVDAKYPKYDKVIPDNTEGSCRVGRQKMANAVRGASIMARAKENKDMVEMSITDESIKFQSSTNDIGSADEEIAVTKKGRDVRFAFNSRYILDFLGVVDDDEIVIEFTEELNPSLFHTDNPDYRYVLMPIKV